MLITIASHKGGVAKTTTAFHLASWLGRRGEATLLVDGDPNRSALKWAGRSPTPLPFTLCDVQALAGTLQRGRFSHIITDTQARPQLDDLASLAQSCDLMVIPSTPDALALDTLPLFLADLQRIPQPCPYRFLITCIPPRPSTAGADALAFLAAKGMPAYPQGIRRFSAFEKAALTGCAVDGVRGDRNALEAWKDYQAIAEIIWESHGQS